MDTERAGAPSPRTHPPPPTDHAKLDQLVQHFYAKTCAVVSQARSTHLQPPTDDHPLSPALGAASTAAQVVGPAASPVPPPQGQPRRASATLKDKARRTNKWFNLELPDTDQFRTELKTWRNLSRLVVPSPSPSSTSSSLSRSALGGGGGGASSSSAAPLVLPMVLDVVLDTSDLSPNQVLVLADQRGKRLRVSAPARRPRQPAHDVYAGSTAAPGGRGSPVPRPRSAGAAPLGPRRPSSATAASSSGAPPTASVAPDVILERWVLSLSPRSTTTSTSTSSASFSPSSSTSYPSPSTAARPPPPAPPSTTTTTAIELPTVYKHAILHFRAQFTLARTLPAWALHRRLARRPFAAAAAGGTGLGLRVRMGRGEGHGGMAGEDEEREGEVGVEEALEGGEGEAEKIVFPGIETPLGTLSLSVTYRLNTDFSVEEIETLLSSRFLDEDFFRPTVARYPTHVQQPQQQHPHQHSSHALRAEPGSLPLTSTSPGGGFALGIGTGGASRASPPVAAAPASTARGMTGLAPLPSYGSLSSRHPYAPHPLGPATTTPHAPSPLSSSPRPGNALPAPVAVPRASHASSQAASSPRPASYMSAGGASPTASHSSSAPRFVAYGPGHDAAPSPASAAAAPSTSTSAGAGAVEPAFISLARARGASYSGGGPGSSSVPRASPLSASPATQAGGFFRRASGGSSSSGAGGGAGAGGFYGAAGTSAGGGGGSPIFRAGSYLGTSALASSSSPSGAPIGRQQPLPLPVAVPAPAGAHPQLSGSPLAGGGGSMSVRPSGLGSYGSQGSYTRSGLMRASSASGGSGSFDEAHAHGHPHGHGSAIVRRPSGGAASRALSFGVAGSLGRSPGGGGGIGGAMASGGAAAGSSGVSRLGTMMAQYDAASSPGGAAAARAGAGPGAAGAPAPAAERRRFVHEGRAPDDADDIEAFLGMLDSKPDLRASDAGGGLGGGLGRSSVAAGGGGGFVSKRDVDEQLRLLRSSVYGSAGPGSAGSGGESASPPVLFGGSAGWAGPSGVSPSPRTSSGLSSLRRQTSRLSIEEDPAAEAAAVAARSPSRERLATGPERTPRAPLRTLYGHGHGRASPTLSATSGTSTAVPPLPQPSAAGVEPRFLPLPLSSTTSPLASPGTHGAHPHYHHHALQSAAFGAYPFAALAPQPYPPLPYPPAAEGSTADSPSSAPPDATTTTASEPVTIAPMRPSSAGAAARGGPSAVAYHQLRRGVGSTTQPTTPALGSEHTSAAASIASFDVDADGGADGGAESSSSYRCEEEPVGRLELDDSEEQQHDAQLQLEAERRGRWGGGLGAEADEEEIARLHSHSGRAAPGRHSRDATPAATRLGGGGSGATAPATGYFARGAGGAAGSSPPEISWMG